MATLRERAERRRQFYKSLEAQALRQRSFFAQLADDLSNFFGSLIFLLLNILFFAFWIAINSGTIPIFTPIDPFPFTFLTMAVSLEAIILAVFILVSQNRSAYVSSLREELDIQVNLIAEEEITKALEILNKIQKKLGIEEKDPALEEMLTHINTSYIEKALIEQMQRANKPLAKTLIQKLSRDFPDILHLTNGNQQDKA
ncbi:MAG: DUF1003 domain-containing protein [Patescibacteria group bacterium]